MYICKVFLGFEENYDTMMILLILFIGMGRAGEREHNEQGAKDGPLRERPCFDNCLATWLDACSLLRPFVYLSPIIRPQKKASFFKTRVTSCSGVIDENGARCSSLIYVYERVDDETFVPLSILTQILSLSESVLADWHLPIPCLQ